MEYAPVGHPLLIAHRGASAAAPENTIAAFALAVAQDADGVELDVRRTADEALVVHHDAALPDGPVIAGLSLGELRHLAPHVPTLSEVAAVTGDLLLNIEIKNHPDEPDFDPSRSVAQAVADWVVDMDLHWRVLVTSFDRASVDAARAADPDRRFQTGLLIDTVPEVTVMLGEVAAARHQWVLPHHASITTDPTITDVAHHHGLRVATWTVDDHDDLLRFAAAGLDAIITNSPAAAHQALNG